jgi:hypothetical protein
VSFIDEAGQLGTWQKPVPTHLPSPVGDAEGALAAPVAPAAAAAVLPSAAAAAEPTGAAGAAAGDSPAKAADDDDDAVVDDDADADGAAGGGRRRLRKVLHDSDDGGFSDHDDDEAAEAALLAEQLKLHGPRAVGQALDGLKSAGGGAGALGKAAAALAAMPVGAAAQDVLYPSSTPMKNNRRFLLWNLTGMVITRDENTYSAVEVDFNNTEQHRTLRLTDHYNFSMAALDDAAVVFGAKSSNGNPSTVVYRPLLSWAPNSEWQVQLEKGEEALAVAVSAAPPSANLAPLLPPPHLTPLPPLRSSATSSRRSPPRRGTSACTRTRAPSARCSASPRPSSRSWAWAAPSSSSRTRAAPPTPTTRR